VLAGTIYDVILRITFLWVKAISSGKMVKNMSDVLVYMWINEGMYGRRGGIKNLNIF
jgi:hypothetical protein